MRRLPTDLRILNAIYDRYYETFTQYTDGDKSRSAKIYVPIDIKQIADDLKVDSDIIFGRLYYHLENKHGYRKDDGSVVPFFSLHAGHDTHCVNFPLVVSVLADLRDQERKYTVATWIAVAAVIISIVSIVFAIIGPNFRAELHLGTTTSCP